MWTLTFDQVGTIVIVAMLCGAAAQAGFAWLLRWSERKVDRLVDEGRANFADEPLGQRTTVVAFDEAQNLTDADVERIVNLTPSLGRGDIVPPRPMTELVDEMIARASLPNVELPEPLTIRGREEAAKRLRELIDSGIVHVPAPHRLFDPARYADGGFVEPKRLCDPAAAEYPMPRTLADALGDDLVPRRRETERYRLDRWVAPDSPSTTPPTEGPDHHDD